MIYLASGSPRRRELLNQMGVAHEVLMPAHGGEAVDETPHAGENPEAYALRVAREKAEAGWARLLACGLSVHPILAADTTVAVDETILGKPVDAAEAARFLRLLSGREHRVISAVVLKEGARSAQRTSITRVWFNHLSDADVEHYIATHEYCDKAGGYALQGHAGGFITRIEGSPSGVMGLPLFETAQLLQLFETGAP